MTPAKKEKPINTFAVLVIESEGKQIVQARESDEFPYTFLMLPVPEHHLPAVEVIKFLNVELHLPKEAIQERLKMGLIHQRFVPRIYFHSYRIELTKDEVAALADAGVPLVKLSIPEEYHPAIDRIHTDILNSFRFLSNPEAGN